MESYETAIEEAVVAREKEYRWFRTGGIIFCGLSLLAAATSRGAPLWFYAVVICYQSITAAMTYPFAVISARRCARAIVDDPWSFPVEHHYPRWGAVTGQGPKPPIGEEPGAWLSIPLLTSVLGLVLVGVWLDHYGDTIRKDFGFVLFAMLLTAATNLLTEGFVWVTKGRQLLHSVIDSDGHLHPR